jgi:succinoglycan biosynthesis protein ExoW
MPARIAVVIPYFQRQPGLLLRALASVNAQDIDEPVRVLVVDDASPHPAREELSDWQPAAGVSIELIEQANAGPGLARNRALDALAGSVACVAFLDSDDHWSPDHLRLAVAALDAGADLYFADTLFEDSGTRLMDKLPELVPAALGGGALSGECLERMILNGFVHTPTVAYRFDRYPAVRFPSGFYRFGEDQTFWLTVCGQGGQAAFATEVQAYGGLGVNIYAGSTWGTLAQFATTAHEIRFRRHALARVPLTAVGRRLMGERLARARAYMAGQILHWLRRGEMLLCVRQLWDDPATGGAVAGRLIRLLRRNAP